MVSVKSRIRNVLFWSIISAAFIGPGTVTTATKAGAYFQFDLLWALAFSIIACILLQEASARITIHSGMNLAKAIAKQFENRPTKNFVLLLVMGAIVLGSAAYETGNILGSMAGLKLIFDIPQYIIVTAIGILALLALSLKSVQTIAKMMGGIVFLMGIAFITTAILLKPSLSLILNGIFIPTIPEGAGAGLLVLGIIGTTVVPYDLFLGSGVLDKSQEISEMRFGLTVAIIIGGFISMAIMIVGTIIPGEFTYASLANALTYKIGPFAVYVFGFGMFAAGFSSAITAPLVSAITAKSFFEGKNEKKWRTQGQYYKMVYIGVLIVGLGFGFAKVEPIPAIIIAQALNGLILPFLSVFLIFVINDPVLMGKGRTNSWFSNILLGIIVWITMILGFMSVVKSVSSGIGYALSEGNDLILIIGSISLLISIGLLYMVSMYKRKRGQLLFVKNYIET
ncbi:MAG: divalent metal cation transporter [Bacteroidetes bacterium]|nr:MAG: divalent metal cation transporter [Bacteroidota bacterium]